ncbi:MAG: hypothetical protein KIT36_16820 [Alphaproteobacteria bacterium]|nr:hypothetical protein [Alphaproteobacteria bacterium]
MTVLRALSRLPLSLWLRGLGAALVLVALLGFGLAVIAAVLVAVGLGALLYKARDWIAGAFGQHRSVPVHVNDRQRGRVSDADYIIIDRR